MKKNVFNSNQLTLGLIALSFFGQASLAAPKKRNPSAKPVESSVAEKSSTEAASVSATTASSQEAKTFHVGGAFIVPTKISDNPEPSKYRGLEGEFGKKFIIGNNLSTTSSAFLQGIAGRHKEQDVGDATVLLLGLGIRQNLGFDFKIGDSNILTPHLRLGAALGQQSIEGTVLGYKFEAQVGYHQFLAGVGIRHQISSFAWFLNYDMTRITSGKEVKYKLTNGSEVIEEKIALDSSERNTRLNTIMAGVSFVF